MVKNKYWKLGRYISQKREKVTLFTYQAKHGFCSESKKLKKLIFWEVNNNIMTSTSNF